MQRNRALLKSVRLAEQTEEKFISPEFNTKLKFGDINDACSEISRYFKNMQSEHNSYVTGKVMEYTIERLYDDLEILRQNDPAVYRELLPRAKKVIVQLENDMEKLGDAANYLVP